MNINGVNPQPNVSNATANTKMLVKAKEHQEMQGQMALQLIEAADISPKPAGSSGHIINTKV